MFKGVAHSIVIARIYDGVLDVLKVKRSSMWRHPLVHTGAIFAIQGGASYISNTVMTLLERQAGRKGGGWLATWSSRAFQGLKVVGRVLGPIASAIGLCNLADGLIFGGRGNFEATVARMCYEMAQAALRSKAKRGGWSGIAADLTGFAGFLGHIFFPSWTEEKAVIPYFRNKVMKSFISRSKRTRRALQQFFRYNFLTKVAGKYSGGHISDPNFYTKVSLADYSNNGDYTKWIDGIVRLPINRFTNKTLGLSKDDVTGIRRGFALLHFVQPGKISWWRGERSLNVDIPKCSTATEQ
jgi:hypothetical protein